MSAIIFVIILAIIFVLYRIYKHNAPKRKGSSGEAKVYRKLKRLRKYDYKILKNLLIRTLNGTSQMDLLVISIYGIFVIETKHYDGWIHGGEKSEYWSQTIYNNKQFFRNPIKQNWSHIFALKEILSDYDHIPYYPIVVFSGKAELKNVYASVPVIYKYQLKNTIVKLSNNINITPAQVDEIVETLTNLNIQDRKVKREHLHNIYHQMNERAIKQQSLKCPECGGDLILRNGKYGEFYGCTNYPKCIYTRNFNHY